MTTTDQTCDYCGTRRCDMLAGEGYHARLAMPVPNDPDAPRPILEGLWCNLRHFSIWRENTSLRLAGILVDDPAEKMANAPVKS